MGEEKEIETGGLLVSVGKVNSWMLRLLCENPWEGGGGHQPTEVAGWSPDQVWFRLCDKDLLKLDGRTQTMAPGAVRTSVDGVVAGRAADGTPIKGRIAGKSLARQLMERVQARKKLEQEAKSKKGRRRRRRHGN